jgi:signal transduction histidine kinase
VETKHTGGLSGMRERARMHGGSLTIASRPGAGTEVLAKFPLDDRNRRRTS